ncbi:hypothetical protein Taro_031849, partial [Colocasia esculenta]|nr:hypothetical protein [Colocasia esculenta]
PTQLRGVTRMEQESWCLEKDDTKSAQDGLIREATGDIMRGENKTGKGFVERPARHMIRRRIVKKKWKKSLQETWRRSLCVALPLPNPPFSLSLSSSSSPPRLRSLPFSSPVVCLLFSPPVISALSLSRGFVPHQLGIRAEGIGLFLQAEILIPCVPFPGSPPRFPSPRSAPFPPSPAAQVPIPPPCSPSPPLPEALRNPSPLSLSHFWNPSAGLLLQASTSVTGPLRDPQQRRPSSAGLFLQAPSSATCSNAGLAAPAPSCRPRSPETPVPDRAPHCRARGPPPALYASEPPPRPHLRAGPASPPAPLRARHPSRRSPSVVPLRAVRTGRPPRPVAAPGQPRRRSLPSFAPGASSHQAAPVQSPRAPRPSVRPVLLCSDTSGHPRCRPSIALDTQDGARVSSRRRLPRHSVLCPCTGAACDGRKLGERHGSALAGSSLVERTGVLRGRPNCVISPAAWIGLGARSRAAGLPRRQRQRRPVLPSRPCGEAATGDRSLWPLVALPCLRSGSVQLQLPPTQTVEVHCPLPPTMVEPKEMIENVAMTDSIEVREIAHIVESWDHSLMIEAGFDALSDHLFEISTLSSSHPPMIDVLFNIDSGDFDVVWLDFLEAHSGRQFEICAIMICTACFTHVLVYIFLLLRHFKIRGRIFSKWGRLTGTVTRDGRETRLETADIGPT